MDVLREQSPEPARTKAAAPSHAARIVLVVLLVAAAVGGGIAFRKRASMTTGAAASASAASEARVVPVLVVRAERRDVPVYLDGLGNAQPLATVTVKSQV